MSLTLPAVLAASLMLALLAAGGLSLTRGAGDTVLMFLLGFGLFYGFRPLLIVLGLDVPFPEQVFVSSDTSALLATTLLGLSLFLALILIGIAAVTESGVRGFGPFFIPGEADLRRSGLVVAVLTLLAAVISTYLVARFGGVGQVITAAKVDKALAGMFVLRTIPAVGAVVAVATFIDARRRVVGHPLVTYGLLACAAADAFFVFLWGSRSVLVIVGAILVLGVRSRGTTAAVSGRNVLLRLALAALLVVSVASGLRVARDTLTRGEVQSVYAQASLPRQASLATNSIVFDAAMLSFRDWPSRYEFRDGEDFYNGVAGLVPRALWPGKPTAIAPGKWFRQVYEPAKVNGWPMGGGALWYLNFGWVGLALGGLLSGLALGLVAAAQRRRTSNGYNTAVGVVIGVYVLGLGWDNETLIRSVTWLVPLWLVGRYVCPRDPSSAAGSPAAELVPTAAGAPDALTRRLPSTASSR